jgi:uncharacterized protein (DUF2267 family)
LALLTPIEHSGQKTDLAQLNDSTEAAAVAAAATRVLSRRITPGELDNVMAQLPAEIREVLRG